MSTAGSIVEVNTESGDKGLFQDTVAKAVVDIYTAAQQDRRGWLEKGETARQYISSSSTATTEVGKLPWKNRTVIPKLTQIVDNLVAYYMAALFPADDWFVWEGSNPEAIVKAKVIEEYMRAKCRTSDFRGEMHRCVRDWVIYGNCFAGVTWLEKTVTDPISGQSIPSYIGPKAYRISPNTALVDPKAVSIEKSYFLKREIVHISDLPAGAMYNKEAYDEIKKLRSSATYDDVADFYRDNGLSIDGFSNTNDYLSSGFVELIEYWGDIYIADTGETKKNQQVIVADQCYCLLMRDNPAWSKRKPFSHAGWRLLPDNLYGQAPIDQLVGMQYRCDHLENLKADAFDQIIHPMIKIKGDTVEDFEFGPNQRIYTGAEGDVEFLRPDASVLQCNNEIAFYHNMMEQMAGSPRESMGFRTPGEKTAFEVDVLQKGADRMFLDKTLQFEGFVESLLNSMFELIMMNLNFKDVVRIFNDETKQETFKTITKEDVAAIGALKPTGSKHYAARSKRVQEMTQFGNMVRTVPGIAAHVSTLNIAKMMEEELGYDKWNIVEEYIGIKEQVQAQVQAQMWQKMAQQAMGGEQGEQGQVEGAEGTRVPPDGTIPGRQGDISQVMG